MNYGTDRTSDFFQVLQSTEDSKGKFKGKKISPYDGTTGRGEHLMKSGTEHSPINDHVNGYQNVRKSSKGSRQSNSAMKAQSHFASIASQISSDIAITCGRLESLSALARQRTLFNDNSTEVQQLIVVIKENIGSINHRIAELQSISRNQSSNPSKQSARHSSSVLMNLQTRLVSMSDKFKTVLENRSKALQLQSARRNEYTARTVSSRGKGGVTNVGFEPDSQSFSAPSKAIVPSILLQDEQRARSMASGSGRPDNAADTEVTDFAGHHLDQEQQLAYRDQTEAYLVSRQDTVRTIEHTIVELGEIFQQLATMVHEQDESIQRIDANVDDALTSVHAGHDELLRYFRSVSSNRWLMLKIFGILIVFFIFFVVFIV